MNYTLEDLFGMIENKREVKLCVNWKPNAKAQLEKVESPTYHSVDLDPEMKTDRGKKSNHISIYDCLNTFIHDEVLHGANKWRCPQCKKEVPAMKQISIDRLP